MRRWKKISVIVGIIATLLIVPIAIVVHLLSGSSEGTVQVGTPPAPDAAAQPVPLKTPLFAATLPAGFSVKRQSYNQAADPQLELEANTPSATDEQVAIGAGPLPSGGLKALGDYNLRAAQTTTYGPFSPASLPSSAVAYRTLTGPTEFTVFWVHSGRYYEISISTGGSTGLDQLDTVFTQLMANWHWQ